MGRARNYLLISLVAALVFSLAVQSLPSPRSTDLAVRGGPYAVVDYNRILEARAPPNRWWYIFTQNAEIILGAGTCLSGVCVSAGEKGWGIGVGVFTVILSLVSAGGRSSMAFDKLVAANSFARRADAEDDSVYRYRFIEACDRNGLHDEIPQLLAFGNRTVDTIDLAHTPWGNVHVERHQVIHPVKRDMRSVVKFTIPSQQVDDGNMTKRQDQFYGVEGYLTEQSDYGYPPDNGWLGETAQAAGQGMDEYHQSGATDMCAKIKNFDGAVAHAYLMYDGTPSNDVFDQVFGCDTFDYGD